MVGWVFVIVISVQESGPMLHLRAVVKMFRFLAAQIRVHSLEI
jgi:hypothetical protein